MKEILWMGLAAGLLFLVFLTVLIFGLINKKRTQILTAAGMMLVALGLGIFAFYQFASKTFEKVADSFQPRTGLETYTALLGRPAGHCVVVVNTHRYIYTSNEGAWLEFHTCPGEVARVAAKPRFETFTVHNEDTLQYYPAYGPRPTWWIPHILGDSLLVLRDSKYINRGKLMLVSTDSTYGFFCDMPEWKD